MKKNLKKILIVEVAIVIVLGIILICVSNSHLGKFTSNDITIDVSEPIDIDSYVSAKDGTEITYELDENNSQLIVNLTKGDKTETIKSDVTIVYPRVEIHDGITIDTFTGYNINDLVDADDGVVLTSSLDESTGVLTVTYTKGDYTNTVSKTVTVTSSDPKDNSRYYDCTNIRGVKYEMYAYPDGMLVEHEISTGNYYKGKYEMTDANNGTMYKMSNWPSTWSMGIYFSDDSSEASFFIGNGSSRDACTLKEVKMGNQEKADEETW